MILKGGIIYFMQDFHKSCKLSNNLGASFDHLDPEVEGAETIKDFWPISLRGS